MLVARDFLNDFYCDVIANRKFAFPTKQQPPEGAIYRSSQLRFKVPRAYFLRHGLTVLREAFEGMASGDTLWNEDDEEFVCLYVARWAILREGPVMPASGA